MLGGKSPPDSAIVARGVVVHEHASWRLVLELRDGDRTRERRLKGNSCAEVARAAALVLAIAIDPERGSAFASDSAESGPDAPGVGSQSASTAAFPAPVAETSGSPHPLDASAPPPPASRPILLGETEQPAPRTRLQGRVGLGTGVTLGIVDGPALGLFGWQGLVLGRGELELREILQPTRDVRSDAASGYGEITVLALGMHGCWQGWRQRRTSVAGCLGGQVAALRGSGQEVTHRQRATRYLSSVTLGLQLRGRLTRVIGVRAGTDLLVAVARPEFYLDNRSLYQPAGVGALMFLGLDAGFP